jgi:hypothetical protein
MTPYLVEAGWTVRRLARRRVLAASGALAALFVVYASFVNPVATARGALSAATALATVVLLIASAGIIADDRWRGRLAVAATHPAPPAVWVIGRWLAVWGVAAIVLVAASAFLLAVVGGHAGPGGVVFAAMAALAHLAALAALAVALSCGVGSTAQLLILLAFCVVGAVPPEILAQPVGGAWAAGAARALWTALPTSWALGRLHEWSLAAGAPAPTLALVLVLQPALWLGAGARRLSAAELAARGS